MRAQGRRWTGAALSGPIAAFTVTTLLLTACGSGPASDEGTDEVSDSAQESSSGEGAEGGTAIQALAGQPSTLNPTMTTGTAELYTGCKIFEGLVRMDKEFNAFPGLAESWEISDDGLHYTFHLRKGVEWHDGELFTSADVAWTFENVTKEYGPRSGPAFQEVTDIQTPDDHTIELTLAEPNGTLLPLLACSSTAILPEHIYGDGQDILDHPRNTDDPIGTGPFKFESWDQGQSITLVRNENYWRADEGMPFLDRFILRPFDSPDAAIQALEAGEVDIVTDYSLDMPSYKRLIEQPDLQGLEDTNNPITHIMSFNTEQPPLDDVEVRQAIFRAINREFIVENVHLGLGSPGKSAVDSRLGWAYNPDVDYNEIYPYDPDAAAEQLDAAGYEAGADGTRFEIDVPTLAATNELVETGDIITQNLADVGIEVNLQPLEQQVLLDRVFAEGDFGAVIIRYNTFSDVQLGVARAYGCDFITGNPFTNSSRYCNEEVDELLAKGAAASTPEERAPHYHEFQEIIAEDVPTLMLVERPARDLIHANLAGRYDNAPDAYEFWEELYWEEPR